MRFEKNTDLPESVTKHLPDEAQTIFRDAFNKKHDGNWSDLVSFACAWGALGNAGWIENKDGTFTKKSEQTEKADFTIDGTITKFDEEQRLVFGFASVIEDADGASVVDRQGDIIKADELEKSAYDFVLNVRKAGEMHSNFEGVGTLVESVVLTTEKQQAMGFEKTIPVSWWIGFKVAPEIFEKVKSGELQAFSIGGRAQREEIEE